MVLRRIERGEGWCRRDVCRDRTDHEGWSCWGRGAEGRRERIQNARGERCATMRAMMMHFGESLMAIGAMNIDGHTHFCAKVSIEPQHNSARQHGIVMPGISYCQG
jgi:hypothetical protein